MNFHIPPDLRAALPELPKSDLTVGEFNHLNWDSAEHIALIREMQKAGVLSTSDADRLSIWLDNPLVQMDTPEGPVEHLLKFGSDLAIVTGLAAWAAYKEVKPWETVPAAFSSPLEYLQALGAVASESCLPDLKGYTWNGPTGTYTITADTHKDLRIFKFPASGTVYLPFQSRIIPNALRHAVFAYHSEEPVLAAALISASLQRDIVPAPMKDMEAFLLGISIEEGGRLRPNENDARQMTDTGVWPVLARKDAKSHSFHNLSTDNSPTPYSIYLNGDDLQLYRGESLALIIPKVEWEQALVGVFTQAAKNGGRTSVATLIAGVEGMADPDWKDERLSNIEAAKQNGVLG